ncbi:epidermal retinol dehydrogenase 2-like protein 1 [Sarcoptes scabiei]|uniref:Short-chain dehydrogenase/reductase 3 n=1 Tax=Sarcoptes scabiei TaxID=52283 RepID=A0A131ZXB3_SARSC|nr:epidermal retinol dehydrogenase 2-like protein 1 [Sarcoptes scabiei]
MATESLIPRTTSNRCVVILRLIYDLIVESILWFIPASFWPKKSVNDQIVLVTGAGSGLGRLLSIRFYRLGSKLVLWDINAKALDETVKMIVGEKDLHNHQNGDHQRIWTYAIDLSDRRKIYETAENVRKNVGSVDILVNNAGLVSGKLFMDIPDEKIEATFRVNTLAHFYTIKSFLPGMINRNHGHIVTIASVAGIYGVSYLTDYCASKFANVGMHRSLLMELSQHNLDGIRTTLVMPYFINTGMFAGARPGIFTILNQEEVADRIMQAILTNRQEIVIPEKLGFLISLINLTPNKSLWRIFDFIGGCELMALFRGRQKDL